MSTIENLKEIAEVSNNAHIIADEKPRPVLINKCAFLNSTVTSDTEIKTIPVDKLITVSFNHL